jgi:hypothetical protein
MSENACAKCDKEGRPPGGCRACTHPDRDGEPSHSSAGKLALRRKVAELEETCAAQAAEIEALTNDVQSLGSEAAMLTTVYERAKQRNAAVDKALAELRLMGWEPPFSVGGGPERPVLIAQRGGRLMHVALRHIVTIMNAVRAARGDGGGSCSTRAVIERAQRRVCAEYEPAEESFGDGGGGEERDE